MRKLAVFSGSFAVAAAVFVYLISDVRVLWIAGALVVLSLLCRGLGLRAASVAGIGLAIGLLWSLCYQQIFLQEAFALHERQFTATVRVTQMPRRTSYGIAVQCKYGNYTAQLYGDETLENAIPGDRVSCKVEAQACADDISRRADGIVLVFYAKDDIRIVKGTPNFFERIRFWLQSRIEALYEGQIAGLVNALLTADRSGLSYEVTNALSVAGISHAIAVSGMHVSILLMMISFLCGEQPKLTALIGVPVVILFVLVTGASASVCRAAIMHIMLLCADILHRESDGPTTLGAAAFVLLVQNPWCIADVSFQLSFAAVAGLMVFSEPIRRKIEGTRKKPGKVRRFLARGISATVGATLTTLPLTVFYFGTISLVSIFVNLACLWAVTGLFVLGIGSCILGPAGSIVAWIAQWLGRYILAISSLVARVPYAAAYPDNIALMIWGAAGYFVLSAALLFRLPQKTWILCAVTAAFLLCILVGRWDYMHPSWRLTMLDVGQGQCMILRIEDYIALIDCGGSSPQAAGEQAARYLHSAGVTHVNALILTHYDDDHAGGTEQFVSRIKTDVVYLPPPEEEDALAEQITSMDVQQYTVSKNVRIELPKGSITLLPPVSDENSNNSGICVLATAEEYDILITGDLDAEAESRLLQSWQLPQVELLVAGHHGAHSSTSQALLQAVQPQAVAISVGKDNHYGHPSEETLTRIRQTGAQIYRTDLSGTLYFLP